MKQGLCYVVTTDHPNRDLRRMYTFNSMECPGKEQAIRGAIAGRGYRTRESPLSGLGEPGFVMVETDMPASELTAYLLDYFENVVRLEPEGHELKGTDADGRAFRFPPESVQ